MQVSEKVDLLKPSLPEQIGEVLGYSFNSSEHPGGPGTHFGDLPENYSLLEARVINRIRRLLGVAKVELDGVEPREICSRSAQG